MSAGGERRGPDDEVEDPGLAHDPEQHRPRGLWRCDNTAQDASGNGNHGALVDGAGFVLDVP